ncbi:MAG: flagellar hook-length control protein FliK [Methylobacteriaceae bacterium]|nr:flagellar hook-length control protein FliK [Methylobacteriaceae bacterium]
MPAGGAAFTATDSIGTDAVDLPASAGKKPAGSKPNRESEADGIPDATAAAPSANAGPPLANLALAVPLAPAPSEQTTSTESGAPSASRAGPVGGATRAAPVVTTTAEPGPGQPAPTGTAGPSVAPSATSDVSTSTAAPSRKPAGPEPEKQAAAEPATSDGAGQAPAFGRLLEGLQRPDHAASRGTAEAGAQAGPETGTAAPSERLLPVGAVPVEIGMRSLEGLRSFAIRLAPEDLGRVEVKLDIDQDGRVDAKLVVDRPETLAFLQRDAIHLQRALEQAGLKPNEAGLSLSLRADTPDGGGRGPHSGQADPQAGSDRERSGQGRQPNLSDPTVAAFQQLGGAEPRTVLWTRRGGVDLHL